MLVQVDILHKTDAHYVMDYDVRLPDRGKLLLQIVFNVQLNLASLTRPGIRVTLVSGGLKMVTGLEKDLANEKVRSQLIVFGTIHRTAVSVYNHQLPCVGAGLCKPCQRRCQGPSRQHVLNASYTLTQILCTTITCHVVI